MTNLSKSANRLGSAVGQTSTNVATLPGLPGVPLCVSLPCHILGFSGKKKRVSHLNVQNRIRYVYTKEISDGEHSGVKRWKVKVEETMQDCKTLFACKFTFEQSPWRSQPRSFRVWTLASRPMSRTQRPRGMLNPPFFLFWICSLPLVLLLVAGRIPGMFLLSLWSTRPNLTLKLFNPNHSLTPSPRTQVDH